jgi:hypothetical protein
MLAELQSTRLPVLLRRDRLSDAAWLRGSIAVDVLSICVLAKRFREDVFDSWPVARERGLREGRRRADGGGAETLPMIWIVNRSKGRHEIGAASPCGTGLVQR